MSRNTHWTIDKRIPIAVILAIVLQMSGALVWATQLDARVLQVEDAQQGSASLNEKFARLEERLDYLKQDSAQVKRQLEQLAAAILRK